MPKKRAKRTGAAGGGSSAMTALTDYLRAHPKAAYREVVEAVAKDGHKIYPIMYGRAQVILGLIRTKKRGKRGAVAKAMTPQRAPEVTPVQRRGRPPKTAVGNGNSLQAFLAEYEQLRRERDALRGALEKARRALGKVLV